MLVAPTVGGSVEAKSLVLAISRGPELDGSRERERGSSERWSGGMQCLVGEEHGFVVDSMKCRTPVEVSEQNGDFVVHR